jgi:hypothetical protein
VEILGMFLADSLPPWKLHGTLVNTPSQQTQCTVRQITPTTRFKNCLNYVTGLMPSRLEAEIRKRCAHIQERISHRKSAEDNWAHSYRPYGLIFGVVFIVLSSGPFVAVKSLEALSVVTDVNGDFALLTGLWAVLTLPFAAMIYLIGGMMDAERVVKWFNL